MGPNATLPQMAWTNKDSLSQVWVHHARYVGRDGNCGQGYRVSISPPGILLDNLWDCHQTAEIAYNAIYQNVSIQVDALDNPVIAFNSDNGLTFDLGVLYGKSAGTYTYTYKKLDGQRDQHRQRCRPGPG